VAVSAKSVMPHVSPIKTFGDDNCAKTSLEDRMSFDSSQINMFLVQFSNKAHPCPSQEGIINLIPTSPRWTLNSSGESNIQEIVNKDKRNCHI